MANQSGGYITVTAWVARDLWQQLTLVDGGIATCFDSQWEAESAIKVAFSCVYFLAQEEMPHTTKYQPLMRTFCLI